MAMKSFLSSTIKSILTPAFIILGTVAASHGSVSAVYAAPSSPTAIAGSSTQDVAAILAASKAATGGDAWDAVRTMHEKADVNTSGLAGSAEEWDDVLTGRSTVNIHVGPITILQGYDGKQAWEQDQGAPARTMTSLDDREGAVSSAYTSAMSYWYTNRLPGSITYLRHDSDGQQQFDVLRVAPVGGYPFELWIDQATHLISKTVEEQSEKTITTSLSNYTAIAGGLRVPFNSVQSDGTSKYNVVTKVQSITVNDPVPDSRFAVPTAATSTFTISGDANAVTVPFNFKHDHIYIPIAINGKPFSAIFDSGGAYIVSPEVARELNLKPQGAAEAGGFGTQSVDVGFSEADTVQIAGLTLRRPLFMVLSIPSLRNYPIVGYEMLQQFVVTIDYDHNQLTLTRPDSYKAPANGVSVPFRFNNRTPEVDGTVDGVPGVFTIDTGSGTGLSLTGPFIAANHLAQKYQTSYTGVVGFGVGGPEHAAITRAQTLTLGGITVHDPLTEFATDTKGSGANKAIAGNIGEPVLRQFNVTLDYARQRIIFEKNSHYGEREHGSLTGMAVDSGVVPPAVIDIFPGGAAAKAGVTVGDQIVSINGRAIKTQLDYEEASVAFRSKAGTKVTVVVRSKGQMRTVTLIVRDMV